MKITRTTTPIIDAISKIHITGNITPRQWYKRITIKMRNGNTKPDLYAINLLSEILYWYRPMEVRDESTGEFIGYKRRFDGEYLQRSYASIGNMFGVSKDTAKDTVDRMKAMGLVGTIVKDIQDRHGNMMFNALHIYPIPEAIAELASSDCDDCSFEVLARSPTRGGGQVSNRGGGQVSYTNTENTVTEITKDKEDHFNFRHSPLAGECSQTPNEFDVNANAEATHRRKNENENSDLLSKSDEYLKRKAEKPKKSKPPVKPKKALFSSQIDKRSHPFTLAALKAIEGVIMEDSEHNFWIDSNTGRPVIQTANIDRVEENLQAIGDTVPRGKESPLEAAITAVIDLYEVRFAKKAQKVDLSLIAGIGMCRWKDNGEMDAEEYAEWVNGVLY